MKYCEDGFGVSGGFFDVLDAVDDVELWMLLVREQEIARASHGLYTQILSRLRATT